MRAPFYFHRGTLDYCFGPRHPLKPERLRRTLALLEVLAPDVTVIEPRLATFEEVQTVHGEEFLRAMETLSGGGEVAAADETRFGFASSDNRPFPGMWESALSYCGGAVQAADDVLAGAPLAFNIAGGLHHAKRERAAGFCLLNDQALIAERLKGRFERILYVDIDVHHGDGVQEIFRNDTRVLTLSIHESPASLWPGTGDWNETDHAGSMVNVPVLAQTTGDVWLRAFERVLDAAAERYEPEVVVLQMGTDTHFADPLAHLAVTAQEWLGAVAAVKRLGLPIVASGGGGYNLTTVPRMWGAATLHLMGIEVNEEALLALPVEWQLSGLFDGQEPQPRGRHAAEMEQITVNVLDRVVSRIPRR